METSGKHHPEEDVFVLILGLVREVLTTVVPALLLALFINVYVTEAASVDRGPSMEPNLYVGYRVMTEKVSYRLHEPRRGDVVVVERPQEGINLIKRVVAVPGEEVMVRNGYVWIDGKPLEEPWVRYFGGAGYPSTVVPAGHVFVLGDNRPNSRDSRQIGPVTVEKVKGHAIFIYWPPQAVGLMP